MRKIIKTTAVTGFMVTTLLAGSTYAQVNWSCKNAYRTGEAAEPKAYPDISSLKSPEIRQLEDKISGYERKIDDKKYKKGVLQKEVNGEVFVPFYMRTDEMKALEKKLDAERADLDSEIRKLPGLKEELTRAQNSFAKKGQKKDKDSDEKPGGLFSFFFGSSTKNEWTKEELELLEERVEVFEKNIPIRRKNIQFYLSEIDKASVGLKAQITAKSKAELEEILAEEAEIRKKIAAIEAEKAALTDKARGSAVALLTKSLKDARLKKPIWDLIGHYSVKVIPKRNKVTLLIGNNLQAGSKVDYETTMQLKAAIQKLVARKYYIVFDADSVYAPFIAKLTGEWGIPVMARESAQFSEHKNKVVINNDFMRMETFADSEAVIFSPDSVTGFGLYSEGLATHVLDVKGNFETKSIASWVKDLNKRDRNLGITEKFIKTVSKADELFGSDDTSGPSWKYQPLAPVEKFKAFHVFRTEDLSVSAVERLLSEGISFAKVMDKNSDTGGSVIFGSGKEDKHSANLVYQSAYKLGSLGIAVATGGSGGAMEIANSGAYNSGGPSIGIPIGGKYALDSEKNFATSKHTKTIMTSGYTERIPALLGEGLDARKLIIFAPGGNGTIKELATTFVRSSGKFNQVNRIVFLDADYYGPLVDWLKASNLPQAFKDKIVLIDKAEEIEALGKQLQEGFEKNRMAAPRKEQLTYEVKTYKYLSGSYYSPGDSNYKAPDYKGSSDYKGSEYKDSYDYKGSSGYKGSSDYKGTESKGLKANQEFKSSKKDKDKDSDKDKYKPKSDAKYDTKSDSKYNYQGSSFKGKENGQSDDDGMNDMYGNYMD